MYQKTTIIGNLGGNPELKYLVNGTAVTSFSMAVNNQRKNPEGEVVKETTWFRVSVFGKQAESCAEYLTKGRMVLVEGTLKGDPATGGPRLYERKDGTVGASFELVANSVKFLPTGAPGEKEKAAPVAETAEMALEQFPF
ncbi:MAG: single-stranded DNA-binding protein [Chloroflexi bacterium]|nr:single-stranded DNA-binding protein [Chloroflexota bacterium]